MSENDDAPTTEPETPDQPDQGEQESDDLGDKGKRALNAERRARSKAERERDAMRKELEKFRETQQTEAEKALAQARREGEQKAESEWKARWRKERIASEAIRAMSGRVSDPRLALPHLQLPDDALDDEGHIDKDVLREAVDDLLDEYPALATDAKASTTASHHADIGAKPRTKKEMSADDLLRIALGGRRR